MRVGVTKQAHNIFNGTAKKKQKGNFFRKCFGEKKAHIGNAI